MGLLVKFGKDNTKQGYQRVISGADMSDCYSYGVLARYAVSVLQMNRTSSIGRRLGYCLLALRQVLFAKIKRDIYGGERLPLGTVTWGEDSTLTREVASNIDRIYSIVGEELGHAITRMSHVDPAILD